MLIEKSRGRVPQRQHPAYKTEGGSLGKGCAFKTIWNYYGYNPRSLTNPPGLAVIGNQDFKANNVTLGLRYSF